MSVVIQYQSADAWANYEKPVSYSFAKQVEGKTGAMFWSWNGNGKERV